MMSKLNWFCAYQIVENMLTPIKFASDDLFKISCRFRINIVALIVCGGFVFGPCFVTQYLVSFLVFNQLAEVGRADCVALIVFLLAYGCKCSVSLSHDDTCWPALCKCGISWSYSLFLIVRVRRVK